MRKTISIILAVIITIYIIPATVNAKTVTTFSAASRYISSKMLNAQKNIKITIKTKKKYTTKQVYNKVFTGVLTRDNDVTNMYLGDYLSVELIKRANNLVSGKFKNNYYYYTIKTKSKYNRTKTTESKFRKALKSEEKRLGLASKSRTNQIRAIHYYVINRVSYNKSYNTAYHAYNKKASACMGYSYLFYLMCRDVGVPCRVVSSKSHAWNIVKVGNYWYNIDCTWDDEPINYNYYLKSTKSLSDKSHQLSSKYKSYSWRKSHPMATNNYY